MIHSDPDNRWRFLVDPDALDRSRIAPVPPVSLTEGQARFSIDQFALTSNNVTYVLTAGEFGYDRLFPAPDGWIAVPVWGYGRVVESRADLKVGTRFFGLWPAASDVVLTPVSTRQGFRDAAPHRAALNPVYNGYQAENAGSDRHHAFQAALRPLYILAHVLAADLRQRFKTPPQTIITSASSRTAVAAAWALGHDVHTTGLTSAANLEFAKGFGVYSKVACYDALSDVEPVPSVILDFAGRQSVTDSIVARIGRRNAQVIRIGWTHGETSQTADANVETYFAPDRIVAQIGDAGAAAFSAELETRFDQYLSYAADRYEVRTVPAPDALLTCWRDIIAGTGDPADILSVQTDQGQERRRAHTMIGEQDEPT